MGILTPGQVEAARTVRARLLGGDVAPPVPSEHEPANAQDLCEILSRPFSDSWARDGLELRSKSIATMSMLIALGAKDELQKHFIAALRLGIEPEEVVELLIHSAGYCGVARAHAAYVEFAEVLAGRAHEFRPDDRPEEAT